MADGGHRLVGGEEVPGDPNQVGIVAQVFGRPASRQHQRDVVLGLDLLEGDLGLEMIAGAFLGDVPALGQFVDHEVIPRRCGAATTTR